jgi:DNA-directed RNA polymerase specialized sigma24 family protein
VEQDTFRSLNRRLTAFALRLFAEHGLSGADAIISGTGISAEDLVGKILVEYCEGKIKHHPSRGSLITLLCTGIRNDFYDALSKASHDRETVPDEGDRKSDGDSVGDKALAAYPDPNATDPTFGLDEQKYQERVLSYFADEVELREVCEAVFYLGLRKPAEIADCLGISVNEFHNHKKKLRLRLVKYGIVRLDRNAKETKSGRSKK